LNDNAPPYLPDVDHVVFETVPLLPFPDASVTVVPDPSSNAYAATRPDVAANATFDDVAITARKGWLEQLSTKNLPTANLPVPVRCPAKW
jgi:hypothetical protein